MKNPSTENKSSPGTDPRVTRTYFLYPLERSPDALSPDEYENKFLEAIAESFRAFGSSFTLVTVTLTVAVSVPPFPSLIV